MLVEFSNLKLTNEAKIIESLISWVWFSLIVCFFGYGRQGQMTLGHLENEIGSIFSISLYFCTTQTLTPASASSYHASHILPFYIYLWVVSLFSQIPLKLILVTHIHIAFPVGSCKIYLKYIATRQVPAEGRRMKAIYFLLFNNNKLIVYQMRPRRRTVCSDRNHIFPLSHPTCSACAWERKIERNGKGISFMVAWGRDYGIGIIYVCRMEYRFSAVAEAMLCSSQLVLS